MKNKQKLRTWNLDFKIKPNSKHSIKELEKLLHYTNLIPRWNDEIDENELEHRKQFPEMYGMLKSIDMLLNKEVSKNK